MEYKVDDLRMIAKELTSSNSEYLPECILLDEPAMYECCFDMKWDAFIWNTEEFGVEILSDYFAHLADRDDLIKFLDYYINKFIDNKVSELVDIGLDVFSIKSKVLTSINSLWSIPNQEFGIDKNGKISLIYVDFKEYDKIGYGGFSVVYNCSKDETRVCKVLCAKEKTSLDSIHRFKREYAIMSEHNNSGYTLNVYDFDSKALVYLIEKAKISLEDYIIENKISEQEKDKIVIRCAECMRYLHNKNVIHRDFHPGNILLGNSNKWMITDFGLAKDISSKYSRQTTTTHAVGRAWFTDPIQLFALKDGNYKTDMFSLAKTIDFVMNGNMSGLVHKYSAVVYKATAPDPDIRYDNIDEMLNDLLTICNRPNYNSPQEIAEKMLQEYKRTNKIDETQLLDLMERNSDYSLLLWLAVKFGKHIAIPYVKIANISFNVALKEIQNLSNQMEDKFLDWTDYEAIAQWAIEVIELRKGNDEINIAAARIVEYVATSINRFAIKALSNRLKNDQTIDGHIRAKLSYHDDY